MKFCSGSSVVTRHWMAWPLSLMSSWRGTPDSGVPITAPSMHMDLRLDDVDAGDLLGDRMLDLDARIDLDEVELVGVGIHQELDRAGAAIVGGVAEPQRRLGQLLAHLRRRDRAPARARPPSGCAAAPSSRARTDAPDCRGRRREAALRRAGPARSAFRDTSRPCRTPPWPRACPRTLRERSVFSSMIRRMPRPPPPQLALSISG